MGSLSVHFHSTSAQCSRRCPYALLRVVSLLAFFPPLIPHRSCHNLFLAVANHASRPRSRSWTAGNFEQWPTVRSYAQKSCDLAPSCKKAHGQLAKRPRPMFRKQSVWRTLALNEYECKRSMSLVSATSGNERERLCDEISWQGAYSKHRGRER